MNIIVIKINIRVKDGGSEGQRGGTEGEGLEEKGGLFMIGNKAQRRHSDGITMGRERKIN